MINKIKRLSKNQLVTNFSYMSIIEITKKILPLITLPYIVAIIGVEKFGLIVFAYAVMAYFQLVVDYGFNAIGTKNISMRRDDPVEYSKDFWAIMIAKMMLFMCSVFVFIFLLFVIPSFATEKVIFLFSFGMVLGQFLFPIWFFQGMEKMRYIAIFSIISRAIYTISIFIFIHEEQDYIWIPLLNSISLIMISIISIYYLFRDFYLKFTFPKWEKINYYLREGWHLFLSSITTNLYTTTNTILLSSFTNYTVVGIYSLAFTISGAFLQLIAQFNKVIYPHLARYSNDIVKLKNETRKYFKIFALVLILIAILVAVFAEFFINLLFGSGHDESVLILRVLSFTLALTPLGGFFTHYMIILSKQRVVLKVTFLTMIVNFIFIIPLIFFFQGLGVALTNVIVETFQVFMNLIYNQEIIKDLFNKKEYNIISNEIQTNEKEVRL